MKELLLLIAILFTQLGFANNIQISDVRLASQNTAEGFYMIEFDLSWDNSWRTSTYESNWDAAWVFVKFTIQNQQQWTHADLHYVNGINDGHHVPGDATIRTMNNSSGSVGNGVGVFIYRSDNGIGDVDYSNIQLRWDYADNGIEDDDVIDIAIHAIEMVYVPEGAFYAGDGQQDFGQLEAGVSGMPYQVTSENQITLGGGGASCMGNNNAINMLNADDFDDATSRILPAAFPKGYAAFYCMKYEVSQGQYASFLAHLTTEQRNERDGPHYVNAVNVFPIDDGNHYAIAEYPYRAMDYLSWADAAAYLDWAGLRPLSELEYEKACRGPQMPVTNELAWGNDSWYIEGLYELENEGTPQETILPSSLGQHVGNANTLSIYSGSPSPMRCGIFAASAVHKTRQETGATYYGIMEMSGNAYEPVISIGSNQTRDYSGRHGDGYLTNSGNASFSMLTDWAFVNTVGVGYRTSEVSLRYQANFNNPDRHKWQGIRGVRTASN